MPTSAAQNRPWVSAGIGSDFLYQQQPNSQLYQTQLQGTRIPLNERRNSPMRNQAGMRDIPQPPQQPIPHPHSARIPIHTSDGRIFGAGPQPQQAPAAQNIPQRQPLYHHPPILPQQPHEHRFPLPGQNFSPPPTSPTQLQQQQQQPQIPQRFPQQQFPQQQIPQQQQQQLQQQFPQQQQQQLQQAQQQQAQRPPTPSAHHPSHFHRDPQSPHHAPLPMWFGSGKPPAGYEAAPPMATVPFSGPSHPVIQVAPHPSPFGSRINTINHEAQQSTIPSIPTPSNLYQKSTSQAPSTRIPIHSMSANPHPNIGANQNFGAANIGAQRGGYGSAPPQQRAGAGAAPQCAPGMPCSPHHPNNTLPMWFGEGPTPQFYQRPTEPWHFTFHGKEPIAKAPVE